VIRPYKVKESNRRAE